MNQKAESNIYSTVNIAQMTKEIKLSKEWTGQAQDHLCHAMRTALSSN